jgi:hypothetical protein
MKKLILLLFIPLVSFGQLTLETMSHINDVQSFKRTMIENGFSMDESSDEAMITYNKNGVGTTPEIVAHYKPRENEEDMMTDELMLFIYTPDYKGENETYEAIYDEVKEECEFVELRESVGGDVAYYNCVYKNPTEEMLEIKRIAQAGAESEAFVSNPAALEFISYQVGFNKSGTLFLLHFPAANKSHPTTLNFISEFMKKMIEARDSGLIDSLREQYKDSID